MPRRPKVYILPPTKPKEYYLVSKPPQKPLRSYFTTPSYFEFVPKENPRHFLFYFLNRHSTRIDRSHGLLHSYFCKDSSCPFHHPYGD